MHCRNGKCSPIEYNASCNGTCGCRSASDCPLGQSCITNLCVPWGCKTDSECKDGTICVEGSCVKKHWECTRSDTGCLDLSQCDVDNRDTSSAHLIIIQNRSSQDLYIGAVGNIMDPTTQIPLRSYNPKDGGWIILKGKKSVVEVPYAWQGRFWARTGCSFDDQGIGKCETGDCAGRQKCRVTGEAGATLVEFNFNSYPGNPYPAGTDYYDVSLVDGGNLMAEVRPIEITIDRAANTSNDPYWSATSGCNSELLRCCPPELQKTVNGKVVACLSACTALGSNKPMYCCPMQVDNSDGALQNTVWGAPANCIPSKWEKNYAALFKATCGKLYSFAYDDTSSTNSTTSAPGQYSAFCVAFCDA